MRLEQVAAADSKTVEQVVKEAVHRMLKDQASFVAGVQRGIEQADRGEVVEHEEVLNRIYRLFDS